MPKLFISYRRQDSADATGRLYDRLKARFDQENVFMDLDGIPLAMDFRQRLRDAVSQCDVLLAIIGDHWLDIRYDDGPQKGKRRLDDAQDFVGNEIKAALLLGVPVVPVLVGGARMPGDTDLPVDLKELAYRNAAEVRSGLDFHIHADRLIQRLEELLKKKCELQVELQKATALVDDDPELALLRGRKLTEIVVRDVYERRISEPPGNRSLEKLAQRLVEAGRFPDRLNVVRRLGNIGTNPFGGKIKAAEAHQSLSEVMEILKWYMEVEQPDAVGDQPEPTTAHRSVAVKPSATISETKIAIVPKGLRSFDANDADFFLDLLPGSRDKDGLPESIRFWKYRIEASDEATFTVGVIYGPSGCGKSSLVKAGLLPRLAKQVLSVYIEATADGTETRLLHGLRRRCPHLPNDLDLTATIAALRQGKAKDHGQKVFIVLDQLEQWLHSRRGQENTELAQALRQCDGEHVQCVVLVRDDFWMGLTRFMDDLHIELLQGQNIASVDLFDPIHAHNVLLAFGRAFGRLNDPTSKDQESFLDQVIQGLSQDARIISVRLALFAEMVKGKPWTPATLKEVGGTEGVGVTFLEETFSSRTANPQHRLHQKAAQAVLKSLLPEAGTDIKGIMQSHADLLEASGYASRPKDFDELLRILDSEIRLITPTDPEGKEDQGEPGGVSPRSSGAKYYQLTHDYLVPSLRDWLTRKQKETRRGRAELLLADRAVVWNARPENRQLPSLLQWSQIRWWTAKKNWTPPQRKMMRKAGRYHAVRGFILTSLLLMGVLLGLGIRSHLIERDRIRDVAETEKNNTTQAEGLVKTLLNAKIAQVPGIIDEIEKYRTWADPLLNEKNAKAAVGSPQKLHTSLALLPVDPGQVNVLYTRLLDAEPNEVPVIVDVLAPHKDALRDKLWSVVKSPEKGKESQRLRAASALAKYDADSGKWATAQKAVVNDLVAVPALHLSFWMESLRPVRTKLIPQLSVVFGEAGRKETERSLATDILADYAADRPQELAELVMIANPTQFAVIYPKLQEQRQKGQPVLVAEINKQVQVAVVKDKTVFEKKEAIADDDAKVKGMPAKRYEVRLQGEKKYRLTMDSKDLDSFLVLQDKSGKELAFDDDGGGDLNSLLLYAPSTDDTYVVFAASFKGTGSFQLRIVETIAGAADDGKEKLAKRQANAAVALLKMGQPEKVWPLLKHSPDPRVRSYLIHRFSSLGADAGTIIQRLDKEPDITIRRALILSLGDFAEKELSLEVRKAVTKKLQSIYKTDADPGLHGASEWLLRNWKQEAWLKQVNEEWSKAKEHRAKRLEGIEQQLTKEKEKTPPQWYVNGQGQTMVIIPGPVEFLMGSPSTEAERRSDEGQQKKRIGRTFALAAKSVTMEQYRMFEKSYDVGQAKYHRVPDLPVVGTEWYRGAKYCNWLSQQEEIPEDQWCYEIKGKDIKLKTGYLSLSGYRLPTEAEMEYATRSGALTSRYFGETEELLGKYAWYQKNSQEKTWPVGSLKPNDFGLFDMQGNTYTWCQEDYKLYSQGKEANDDNEDDLVIISTRSRVLRGGSFIGLASIVRSAYRANNAPSIRSFYNGFRVARTLPLVPFTPLQSLPEGDEK